MADTCRDIVLFAGHSSNECGNEHICELNEAVTCLALHAAVSGHKHTRLMCI